MKSFLRFGAILSALSATPCFADCPVAPAFDLLGGFAELACVTLRDAPEIAAEIGLEDWMPSIASGEGHAGHLHFAWHLDKWPGFLHTRNPNESYSTMELWLALNLGAIKIATEHPGGFELVVSDISRERGGKLKPHFTHQHGRDVDLRFFQKGFEQTDEDGQYPYITPGLENLDTERTWAFLEALYDSGLVSVVLMDWRIQKMLYDSVKSTCPPERLAAILSHPYARSRNSSMVRHAKNHYSHFHVRTHSQFSRLLSLFWSDPFLQNLERKIDLTRNGRFSVTVESGDTLGSIALRNRVSVDQLMEWNQLTKRSILHPGQKLWIVRRLTDEDREGDMQAPSENQPEPAPKQTLSEKKPDNPPPQSALPEIPTGAKKKTIKVRSGDTLGGIAKKNHVSLEDLMNWNQLTRSSILHPGQELQIYLLPRKKK